MTATSAPQRERTSPFAHLRPVVLLIATYLLLAGVWALAGPALPGGRWLAVHLFTLGVITNAVLAFTRHFAVTVLRSPEAARSRVELVVVNAGIVVILAGLPTGMSWLVAVGATIVTAVVLVSYAGLRRARRAAIGPRFRFVVRAYERAHGAFIHGAVLGALLGLGVLPGAWHVAARDAHLHVNVLGWAGLTLLATVVFFGPTVARTRMEPGADDAAARALRTGATALTVGVFALLGTGLGGTAGTVLRLTAAVSIGGYAVAASVVCLPVIRAVSRAPRESATGLLMLAASSWLALAVWVDAAAIAFASRRLVEVAGLAMLVGAIAQAVVATIAYVAPLISRSVTRERLDAAALVRVAFLNAALLGALAAAVTGGAAGPAGSWVLRGGLGIVTVSLIAQLLLALPQGREQTAVSE